MSDREEALRRAVRAIVPAWSGFGMRWEGDGRPAELLDPEPSFLSRRAVARRQLEFRLGRAAARDALVEAGWAPGPIHRGARGEPVWPDGVVGAISHADHLAIALVAPTSVVAGVGVDVERVAPRSESIDAVVCTPEERAWIDAAADDAEGWRRRINVFSAKEAIFKAVFPATGLWLDYRDASLTWRGDRGGFDADVPRIAGRRLQVRCLEQAGYVVTATWLLHGAYPASERTGPTLTTGEGVG